MRDFWKNQLRQPTWLRKIMGGGYSSLAFLLSLKALAPFWKIPLDWGGGGILELEKEE